MDENTREIIKDIAFDLRLALIRTVSTPTKDSIEDTRKLLIASIDRLYKVAEVQIMDAVTCGVGITKDGERITPEDFYKKGE